MKNQILNIINNKNKNYDNSNIKFSELMNTLSCTSDELAIFINGCADARIENRIIYDL